jgi:selenocysteine lyase/cysteine desulfurase
MPAIGFTQSRLMEMPLPRLALVALQEAFQRRDRINAAEALHARVDELNGAAWTTLSEIERLRIKAAMQIDTTNFN